MWREMGPERPLGCWGRAKILVMLKGGLDHIDKGQGLKQRS